MKPCTLCIKILLVYIHCIGPLDLTSQSHQAIENLYQLLFLNNIEIIDVQFESKTGFYLFQARDFYPEYKKIDSILLEIRKYEPFSITTDLHILLDTLEKTFIQEWEPIWRKDIRRYESFYYALRNIEQTLQYFHITYNLKTPDEKYKYVKSLILFELESIYSDSNSIVVFSNYIHHTKHRACIGSAYCSFNLLEDIWYEVENEIINEICSLQSTYSDPSYNQFINSLLIYSRYSLNLVFDSCFLSNWDKLHQSYIYDKTYITVSLIVSILNRNNNESINALTEMLDYTSIELHDLFRLNFGSTNFKASVKENLKQNIINSESKEFTEINLISIISLITHDTLSDDLQFLSTYLEQDEIDAIKLKYNE